MAFVWHHRSLGLIEAEHTDEVLPLLLWEGYHDVGRSMIPLLFTMYIAQNTRGQGACWKPYAADLWQRETNAHLVLDVPFYAPMSPARTHSSIRDGG